MDDPVNSACTICGERPSAAPNRWFLVAESRWEDKLKILPWNEQLAESPAVHRACCPAHVQELLIHWMATGSLDYPFARTGPAERFTRRWSDVWAPRPDANLSAFTSVGELSVHRESMRRMLTESPGGLKSILDAVRCALQPDPSHPPTIEHIA
ncbi:MAG TPA: hypothetical protein VGF06_07580 [Terriglobales bacterium]|jgi:hypothetical protein